MDRSSLIDTKSTLRGGMGIASGLIFLDPQPTDNHAQKLVALAATALFSRNASAGYVRYDLEGTVSGYFVQHDDDKTIADYSLMVNDPDNANVRAQFSLQAFLIMPLPLARLLPAPVRPTSIRSIT